MNLFKRFCFFTMLLMLVQEGYAQKVKRKGVESVEVKNPRRLKQMFSTEQLVGKWQEITRRNYDSVVISFTDTIYLNFLSSTRVITRQGNAANMSGAALIERPGNVLLAAADVYTITSINDSVAVFDNQEGLIHLFKKQEKFYFEDFGKISIEQEIFTNPISTTLADVLGNWNVYRKDAKPGTIHPPTNVIQTIKITDSTGENTAKGEVTFYQTNQSMKLPCTVKVTNTGIDITADTYNWQLFVYKANKTELVFGDASILLYYAKQF